MFGTSEGLWTKGFFDVCPCSMAVPRRQRGLCDQGHPVVYCAQMTNMTNLLPDEP